jgi:hypothetical protein
MKTLKTLLVAGLLAFPLTGCKQDKPAGADKAGDMGGEMAAPPAGGDVIAELDKILEKQKAQYESMKGVKTLEDFKARKDESVKLSVEVFEMQVASLRKAAALPKDQLKAYVDRAQKMQADNAQLGKDMVAMQEGLLKIDGVKEIMEELKKTLDAKMKPLMDEYVKLQKEVAEKLK